MPRAGFEPAISTFERPKTVLASERSAIETCCSVFTILIYGKTNAIKSPEALSDCKKCLTRLYLRLQNAGQNHSLMMPK
jgi:hypothetical protein